MDAFTLAEGRSQNVSNPSKTVSNALNLNFLGAPEVLYQGQPLKFRSRKVLALLIYLAAEGGAASTGKADHPVVAGEWSQTRRGDPT